MAIDEIEADVGLELPRRKILAIVGALMVGNLMAVIDTTIVAVALPTIAAEFGSLANQAWIVVAYMLASTAMVPIYGKFSDIYGRKPVYHAAIVIFLVGSLACGVSQEMWQLITARVVQGLGAGGLMVSALAIVGEVVSPRQRGRYQAYFTVVASAGIVAGPAVGGVLVDSLSWRWIFFINLPIGLVALLVIGIVLDAPHQRVEHKVDFLGSFLLVSSVVCFLLAMVWGGQRHAWSSATIIGLLAATAIGLVAFAMQERSASEPVVPLRLLRLPAVSVSAAYAFGLSLVVMGGTIIPVQQVIQVIIGAKASDVWRYLTPFAVLNVVSAIAVGRLIARFGRYRIFPVLAAFGVLGVMLLFHTIDVDTSGVSVAAYLGLLGLAMGFGAVVPVLAAQNAVDQVDLGVTSGVVNFFQQMGASVGTAIFGTIFATRLAPRIEGLIADGAVTPADVAGPDAIRELDDGTRSLVAQVYAEAVNGVYLWTSVAAIGAIVLALAMRDAPLKSWSFAARALQEDAD